MGLVLIMSWVGLQYLLLLQRLTRMDPILQLTLSLTLNLTLSLIVSLALTLSWYRRRSYSYRRMTEQRLATVDLIIELLQRQRRGQLLLLLRGLRLWCFSCSSCRQNRCRFRWVGNVGRRQSIESSSGGIVST